MKKTILSIMIALCAMSTFAGYYSIGNSASTSNRHPAPNVQTKAFDVKVSYTAWVETWGYASYSNATLTISATTTTGAPITTPEANVELYPWNDATRWGASYGSGKQATFYGHGFVTVKATANLSDNAPSGCSAVSNCYLQTN